MDALSRALATLEAEPPAAHRAAAAARAAAIERLWWDGRLAWWCPGPHGPLFCRVPDHSAMQRIARTVLMEVEP